MGISPGSDFTGMIPNRILTNPRYKLKVIETTQAGST